MGKRVVVVGGGIAGLTSAYTLLKQARCEGKAFEVTILEAETTPGGQARGFAIAPKDRNGNEIAGEAPFVVEHGSHVFFAFYDTIIKLIAELRDDASIGPGMPAFYRVPGWTIVDAYGTTATLKQSGILPEPFNVAHSIFEIPWLPLEDRVAIGLGALKIINRSYDEFGALDQMTSEELGLASGYTKMGLLAWNSASLGLTNLFIQEQSGAIFCAKHKVLIGYPDGLSYQLPAGNLSEMFAEPMKRKLETMGARFVMGARATCIARADGENETSLTYTAGDGAHTLAADHVLLAVSPVVAKDLVPWVDAAWKELIQVTPVLTVVMRLSGQLAASKDGRELGMSREQWVFSVVTDLSRYWPAYEGSGKTVLRCEIGHADRLPNGPDTSDAELIKLVETDLGRLFPEIVEKGITIEAYAVHSETQQLYVRWAQGQWSKKPTERAVGKGVFLAGDWTTKGTIGMEAAANSGIEAANHVLVLEGLSPVPFRDIPL